MSRGLGRTFLAPAAIALALIATSCGSSDTSASQRLAELGGSTCPDSEFTCITLGVPLDHFGSSDQEIDIQFAVRTVDDPRGVFVTVVGGPGASGVDDSVWLLDRIPERIRSTFDIVFFDQRGVDLFGDASCPHADEAESEALGDEPDWESKVTATQEYVGACIEEIGNPEALAFLGTDQAIRDLELFRETMGYERLTMWGQSYGTSFAQAYATEFPARVDRLILDGPVNRTSDWVQRSIVDAEGQTATLRLVFEACDADAGCSADMGMAASDAYAQLIRRLTAEPATVAYPIEAERTEEELFTAEDLDRAAYKSIYSDVERVLFLRALATASHRQDLLPLVRLDETDSGGLAALVNETVNCLDISLRGDTIEEELDYLSAARERADGPDRWYHDEILQCVYWPHVDHQLDSAGPFEVEGIPTIIVASTADPATPYIDAVALKQQAPQAHLLTVDGGSHVMFGRENECVDGLVTAFVVDESAPSIDHCSAPVIDTYVPIIPTDHTGVEASELVRAMVDEILWSPKVLVWDMRDEVEFFCAFGGSASLAEVGDRINLALDDCGLTANLTVLGSGYFDTELGMTFLSVRRSNDGCEYHYREIWGSGEEKIEEHCPTDGPLD